MKSAARPPASPGGQKISPSFMASSDKIQFYHSPQSRSVGVRILLEELGVDYDLHVLNLKAGEQRQPAYLAVNPSGKVPAVVHRNQVVTEQVALYIYLADRFPEARLAPGLADDLRGPYLRWMAYYGSCFEPALIDRAMKREPAAASTSPYGDYETVVKNLADQLSKGPFMLGEIFTALDVLWGTALSWTTQFGLLDATPTIKAYIERVANRPATLLAKSLDEKLISVS